MEIKVGISSCLLGEKVRFDGQHKKDCLILGLLGPYVHWVSICPEVEAGMTVPIQRMGLSAYILKKGSPSCGMERVKCYEKNGYAKHDGRGLFAKTLIEAFPELPVEEEGYFKKLLTSSEKQELLTIIKDYRTGLVPLIVPITLIRHYVHKFSIEYLKGQTFLEPNPKELMLRNHV